MKKKINPLWGGRFNKASSDLLQKINNSISFDYKLAKQDIEVSKAYAQVLEKANILSSKEKKKILSGLSKIEKKIKNKTFSFNQEYEDIHMNIEMALKEEVGDIAGKLHTGKSRNDQVTTDLKLWVKEKISIIIKKICKLQNVLIKNAEDNIFCIMPGFTHLQNAQPISLAHYFMAFFEMFERDKKRFQKLLDSLSECPLGSGALSGTNFYKIDRMALAKLLNFKKPTSNSLDSVSDRDYVIEFMSTSSILGMHFSRMAEDFIIWCSAEFSFIEFSDSLSTGSSIMPQKKNPDAAELVRSKTSRIYGNLLSFLTTMKGLPMGYSKDLQEDKESIFETNQIIQLVMDVMTEILKDVSINKKKMSDACNLNFSTATDVADWLVANLNYSFRSAHNIAGKIVKLAERKKCKLYELSLDDFKNIEPCINKDIFSILSPYKSVSNKKSFGGTAFTEIKKSILKAKKTI